MKNRIITGISIGVILITIAVCLGLKLLSDVLGIT